MQGNSHMLSQTQLEKYADVLLWGLKKARTGGFEKNDIMLIKYHQHALPLANILYQRILEMGMHPVQRMLYSPTMERQFFKLANDQQLTFKIPGESELYSNLNGSIFLNAPESIKHLSDIDPEKIGRSLVSQKYLRDIMNHRESMGVLGWTLCIYPTQALAEAAGINMERYCRQIAKACFLDDAEPVSKWEEIFRNAGQIKEWLNNLDVKYLQVESEHIDLKITLGDHRKWIGISGRNIPSFEIFTSPDWRGTHGAYFADQPSYRSGNYVKGVRLEFNNGILTGVSADEGEEFLKKQLVLDDGAAKIGEFSLTDQRFSKIDQFMANTLFDENFGGAHGNCHLAMGSSYENTYSQDRVKLTHEHKVRLGFNDSALHWDLINTQKKRVIATVSTGKSVTIYDDGKFNY
jgi:aminopeptidase